jgi:hypothetical protein
MSKLQSENRAGLGTLSASGLNLQGRVSSRILVQLDLDNGSTVIAPQEVLFKPGALDDVGTIVDIFCKLTGWCGGDVGDGGGGGGKVCYKTVIGTDGTITITPVPCPKPA